MNTAIVEVTNGERNWGKFLVGYFDQAEWARRTELPGTELHHPSCASQGFTGGQGLEFIPCDCVPMRRPLLATIGWDPSGSTVFVLDLQTGEGGLFKRGGYAKADLNKHQLWVCPMFEPFLEWLYRAWDGSLASLPATLDLPDAPFASSGYRRPGPST